MMTRAEAEDIMSMPEYENRQAIYAYEDGDDYVIDYDGKQYRAGNPFGLDSKISAVATMPHNLFLVSKEEAYNVTR